MHGKEKCQRRKHVYFYRWWYGVSKKKIPSTIITEVILIVNPAVKADTVDPLPCRHLRRVRSNQTDSGEGKKLANKELEFKLWSILHGLAIQSISQCNELHQVRCIPYSLIESSATEVVRARLVVGRSACNLRIRIIALVSDKLSSPEQNMLFIIICCSKYHAA